MDNAYEVGHTALDTNEKKTFRPFSKPLNGTS